MPLSAMRQTRVDYCLPLEAIPDVLTRLASEIPAEEKRVEVPSGLEAETRIAMEADPLAAAVFKLGDPSPPDVSRMPWHLVASEGRAQSFRYSGTIYADSDQFHRSDQC
jgi:hypothetical protein